MCENLFKINWSLDISTFDDFTVSKNGSSQSIINKVQTTKYLENYAHGVGGNYLANLLVKFLQDRIKPWGVRALRVSTVYLFFFFLIFSEGFRTYFNSPSDSC